MPSAPSTPSCARPTISPTTKASPANSAARISSSGKPHGTAPPQARRPAIPSSSPSAMQPALQHSAQPAGRTHRRNHIRPESKSGRRARHLRHLCRSLPYCYLVASVVGLVCIRIFGYTDPAAEKLAEETGVAFQLTNILRDVAEDAERGRVYLPLEDLAAHNVTLDSMLHRPAGRTSNPERTRTACRDWPPCRNLLRIRQQAAPAHQPREPSRPVGTGQDLSRPA